MNNKLFLISSIFLLSSFCFAGEIYNALEREDIKHVEEIIKKYENNKTKLIELINSQDSSFAWAPFHYAVILGNLKKVELLYKNGAEINIQDSVHNWTPLHDAVWSESLKITEFLLENGADPNTPDKYGYTPLHIAFYIENSQMKNLLLDNGAKINTKSKDGRTPSNLSALKGDKETPKFLQSEGSDTSASKCASATSNK